MSSAIAQSVRLPPGPKWPVYAQGIAFLVARRRVMESLAKRYGTEFTMTLPFRPMVVLSDPALVKELFQTSTTLVQGVEPNLDVVFGPGSTFGLHGEDHRRRRKLLVPSFHGNRMRANEGVVEEEALKEIASWPEGEEFPVLESMMRITLNSILRAVFGAEGTELDTLRELMPRLMKRASVMAILPQLRHDWGPRSPWGRYMTSRREFDGVIRSLVEDIKKDPNFEERVDVLSLLVQSTYEDGTPMSLTEMADEMFTLLAAGHETTATSLAWAVERLRRHPDILSRLTDEIDAGGSDLLQATINEVQRCRPVIDACARQVIEEPVTIGEWVIPKDNIIRVDIGLIHQNEAVYPEAHRFNPDRFLHDKPDLYAWVPFGGGNRRCIGAAFANMEMNGVLTTMLREVRLEPTAAPAEKWRNRGVAAAPNRGGRAVIRRRNKNAAK
ncbi:cytochrome P450 [Mycobacterium sp. IDR2000157661]|uniref:cytochrome P450 n=1 Tax=Mycobacterium sp. IDR2000157661 TaxID=2867005 RepID=UPI001EEA550B|nr:cytochrome P450 [Mycobacterium sp. IDR2000157661]ULE33613.1 cytochrome P450 [Mycobacterium sp. IDR2000157661]